MGWASAIRPLERQRFVHPVVVLQDLLAVEAGEVLGSGLGALHQAAGADRAPELALLGGVAEEQVVFGAREQLRRAGIALAGGAAVELAVDAEARRRLRRDH